MIVRLIGPVALFGPLTPLQARDLADALHEAARAAEELKRETTSGEGRASRFTACCGHIVQCPDADYGPICAFFEDR